MICLRNCKQLTTDNPHFFEKKNQKKNKSLKLVVLVDLCHKWVKFCSSLALISFSVGTPVYPSPKKTKLPNSVDLESTHTFQQKIKFLRTSTCFRGKQIFKKILLNCPMHIGFCIFVVHACCSSLWNVLLQEEPYITAKPSDIHGHPL